MSCDFSREQVLQAIDGSIGIVSQVARKLSCDWHTAESYINKWESTKQAFRDESEKGKDLSEWKMYQAIQAGDGPMIRFHLSTKGKDRGYSPKSELDVTSGGEPIKGYIGISPDDWDDEFED